MEWANNAVFRGLLNDNWGPPVEAETNGLYSTFKERFPENQNTLKSGQKINDQKMWEEGFDTAIFALSIRSELGTRKRHHSFCPYKLRGTQKTAQEYNTENLAHFRRKLAWNEICDAFNQRSANSKLSTEFEQIAADFFRGRAVEAEYENITTLMSMEPRPYHLDFEKGDRAKVFKENPLADKTLALFLQDVVMANNMESACAGKETYHGLKVYRHDSYKDTLSELRKAPKLSEIITIINLETGRTHNFQDPTRLDKALKAIGVIPGALCDLKDVVSEIEAHISPGPENCSRGSADGAKNAHVTKAVGSPDSSVTTADMVLSTDYPNTQGDPDTLKHVSPGQPSTMEGVSTGLSDIGTNLTESHLIVDKSSTYEPFAFPSRPILLNRKASEVGGTSNPVPNGKLGKLSGESIAPNKPDVGSRPGFYNDKIAVAELETMSSTTIVGSGSIQKKKKGSKRKTVHKGKGGHKTAAVSSSSQGNQDSNHVVSSLHQPSGKPVKLNREAQHGAHTDVVETQATENDTESARIAKDEYGWNEFKIEASHKSKSSRKGTDHVVFPPSQNRTLLLRDFKPEEYPAISSIPLKFKPGAGQANCVPATIAKTSTVCANNGLIWEEDLPNLPAEEIEASRILSQEAEHSTTSSGPPDAGNRNSSMSGARDEHYPGAESVVAMKENLVEETDVATEFHGTGLEWAATELTSPTNFKSRWRHSSLPYRSTAPSKEDFDDSIEISTTRRRSNSTTVLDPRVKAVQFGDFPVLFGESAQGESVAPSAYISDLSHGVSSGASTRWEPLSHANSARVLISDFSTTNEVPAQLTMPIAGQKPRLQAQHSPSTMFMPQLCPLQGYFSGESVYYMVHQRPYVVPYGSPGPGFAHAKFPALSSNSVHIGSYAHPRPITHGHHPNSNSSPKVPIYNYQQVEQASQQEGNNESVTGQSLGDESFEAQSNFDQQTKQSNSTQGSPEYAGYRCSCCFQGAIPNAHRPLYFCPGCGPMCAIRYCSVACLLAHSYQHSSSCMRYPYYQRFDPHNMPPEEYEWERYYIAPIDSDTPERYRQRAFSLYCYHGSFPRVLRAWGMQNELPIGLTGCDVNESFKSVGDYHIFRSAVSANGKKFAPVEIICTLRLRYGDPMKEALNRALNACFLVCESRVVNFLFRLLRHLVLDLDTWSLMMPILDQRTVHAEFIHQFSLEFNFNAKAYAKENDTFSLTQEWQRIRPVLERLEMQSQILQCWFRSISDDIRTPQG